MTLTSFPAFLSILYKQSPITAFLRWPTCKALLGFTLVCSISINSFELETVSFLGSNFGLLLTALKNSFTNTLLLILKLIKPGFTNETDSIKPFLFVKVLLTGKIVFTI